MTLNRSKMKQIERSQRLIVSQCRIKSIVSIRESWRKRLENFDVRHANIWKTRRDFFLMFFLLICQDCKKFIDNRLNLINSKIIYCFLRIISIIMHFRNYLILKNNIVFVEIFRRNLFIVVFEFDHDVINHDINDWLIWLINNVCSRKRKRQIEIAFRVIARDKFFE
jgi:hypothetical protein